MQLDQQALTLAQTHFHTLGSPRHFQLNPTATVLYFTRSADSTSNVHALWQLDIGTDIEYLLFDPFTHASTGELTAEELKQREVLRETSHGITGYVVSPDGAHLCFTHHGSLWLLDTKTKRAVAYMYSGPAFDPHFSPDGQMIAFVNSEGVWTIGLSQADTPRQIIANQSADIYFGRAEFIASEEFERYRGFWWSPDSTQLVIAKVDETAVNTAYGPPDEPFTAPAAFHYPAAGTANAHVSLLVFTVKTSEHYEIEWSHAKLPYITNVQWNKAGLYVTVQNRSQTELQLLQVANGGKTTTTTAYNAKPWVDILQPLPVVTDGGDVISLGGDTTRQLAFNGTFITPAKHHVDDFIGSFGDWLAYTASPDPKERIVFVANHRTGQIKQMSPARGLYSGSTNDAALFIAGTDMASGSRLRQLYRNISGKPVKLPVVTHASLPALQPEPIFFSVGDDALQACLIVPRNLHKDVKLPVILQIYGGPHHQEVMYSRPSYLEAQWWADQGYAVLTVDGPGSPGKNLVWEQRIAGDFIGPAAAAHIAVLREAITRYPVLDPTRVASRGWSFGGYLSAFLSVLYPNDIQASISGAPVTNWELYDTHYTERYLGLPAKNKASYQASSLLLAAKKATRPILLIHGLQDENVMAAHSLQLLQVLGDVSCPYEFIPLSTASHFPKQAEQRAWLLQMELNFLQARL